MAVILSDREDASLVDALITAGADIGAKAENNCSALALAQLQANTEIIARLKQSGAKPPKPNDFWLCYISYEVSGNEYKYSDGELEAFLLSSGANVNARDNAGRTALFHIVSAKVEHVNMLLRHRAEVNVADKNGVTPLMLVHNPSIAKALIQAGAKVNASDKLGMTPLMYAVAGEGQDAQEYVKFLIQSRARVNAQDHAGKSVLMYALDRYNAWFENWEILLKSGANIHLKDKRGRTAISYVRGEIAAAVHDELVSRGLKPSPTDQLLSARDPLELKLALSKGADPEAGHPWTQGNALIVAAREFNAIYYSFEDFSKNIQIILSAGANPNSVDDDGNNALMIVLSLRGDSYRSPERKFLVKLLIGKKTNLTHTNKAAQTALQIARETAAGESVANDEVIQILISAGAK
jgi:ankyrin repeat protein